MISVAKALRSPDNSNQSHVEITTIDRYRKNFADDFELPN